MWPIRYLKYRNIYKCFIKDIKIDNLMEKYTHSEVKYKFLFKFKLKEKYYKYNKNPSKVLKNLILKFKMQRQSCKYLRKKKPEDKN